MAQRHLDRLTATDASFLHQERPGSHMHIGAVLVFEGPAPAFAAYLEQVRSRLHLVPRYRQKLAIPPLEAGNPRWIDDANFNLEYHVRHTALPAPGTEQQLLRLASRIASQRLDRSKPLWESWIVEGLQPDKESEQERFALIFKTHHALVDGISGVDLATVLFDLTPEPPAVAADVEPWHPRPEPSPAELLATTLLGTVEGGVSLISRAIAASVRPSRTLGAVRDALEGVGEIVWATLNPAPDTPLNVPIGPHRRFAVVRQQLADYREVKRAFGGTINDVILTVVSGALASWLRSRGVRTEGVEMRALVPVSVRTEDQRNTLGNRLTAMRGPLPIYIDDPVTGSRSPSRRSGRRRSPPSTIWRRRRSSRRLRACSSPPGCSTCWSRTSQGRSSRSTSSAGSCSTSTRLRSCPRTTRWRSRSCPTTGASSTACSAISTRCRTSTWSPPGSTPRLPSCCGRRGANRKRKWRARPPRPTRARAMATTPRRTRPSQSCRRRGGAARPARPPTCARAGRARGHRPTDARKFFCMPPTWRCSSRLSRIRGPRRQLWFPSCPPTSRLVQPCPP